MKGETGVALKKIKNESQIIKQSLLNGTLYTQ